MNVVKEEKKRTGRKEGDYILATRASQTKRGSIFRCHNNDEHAILVPSRFTHNSLIALPHFQTRVSIMAAILLQYGSALEEYCTLCSVGRR